MKITPWLTMVLALGTGAVLGACGSDDKKPPEDPEDAGSGGGGASTGGRSSTGGGGTGGGTGGSGAGGTPATGGQGGQPATGGAAGSPATGGAGGADPGDSGAGGANDAGPCADALRCLQEYPVVPYPAENQHTDNKAMLGKILFWEEQLGELGNTAACRASTPPNLDCPHAVACGTCHRGHAGGSDPRSSDPGALLANGAGTDDDVRGGMGVPTCNDATDAGPQIVGTTPQVTGVKPPTYLDAMFALEIFWDGRAGHCRNAEASGGCFYDPDVPAGAPLIKATFDAVSGRNAGGALEAQAVGPPTSPVEMACAGQDWPDIHAALRTAEPLRLAKSVPADMQAFITSHGTSYPQMFAAVFGTNDKVSASDPNDVINTRRIAFAIATHERRLTSDDTPWDRWNRGDDSALTAAQVRGFQLFMGKAKCSTCHTPPLFTNNGFHFIAFHRPEWNPGRRGVTNDPLDDGKVKTPTLRNVGLREASGLLRSGAGPGVSLDTVMALYNSGGNPAFPNIDPNITPLVLSPDEITAIIDFLENGLTDARVRSEQPPFDRPHLSSEIN